MATKDMDKLVNHAKSTGFVYQGSEIYDGLANTWDFGPLGVEMKNNIKRLWWKRFIQESPYNVGLDSAIFMNPKVWEASGHVCGFSDPLIYLHDVLFYILYSQLMDQRNHQHVLKLPIPLDS